MVAVRVLPRVVGLLTLDHLLEFSDELLWLTCLLEHVGEQCRQLCPESTVRLTVDAKVRWVLPFALRRFISHVGFARIGDLSGRSTITMGLLLLLDAILLGSLVSLSLPILRGLCACSELFHRSLNNEFLIDELIEDFRVLFEFADECFNVFSCV